jgi:protein-L-isoaspartate O-methyltransferase
MNADRTTMMSDLTVVPEVYRLRPWYHDFSRLGLRTVFDECPAPPFDWARQVLSEVRHAVKGSNAAARFSLRRALRPLPSAHRLNQGVKEPVLTQMLNTGLAESSDAPHCLELFCADGYYSCLLARARPSASVTGVDADRRQIARAQAAAGLLGCHGAVFVTGDAFAFLERDGPLYDVVLCAGGLYHLRDPRRLLELLSRRTAGFLVVQSVVTLESEEPDYFVSPAPGWRHGSRFTHAALRRWLVELGWAILATERNELPGNPRRADRGSSYFLCQASRTSVGRHAR